MNNFTKGNWVAAGGNIYCEDTLIACVENPHGYDLSIYTFKGEYLDSSYSIGERQKESNARLMAAAPEMYEALREIVDCCMLGHPDEYEKTERALAKVEGGDL